MAAMVVSRKRNDVRPCKIKIQDQGSERRSGVESTTSRKKEEAIKYVCAECGQPVSLFRCWIGNEGVLCRKHAPVWRVGNRARAKKIHSSDPEPHGHASSLSASASKEAKRISSSSRSHKVKAV
jgi:hypothetical protein